MLCTDRVNQFVPLTSLISCSWMTLVSPKGNQNHLIDTASGVNVTYGSLYRGAEIRPSVRAMVTGGHGAAGPKHSDLD